MTTLPDPYVTVNRKPLYTAGQMKRTFEAGREAMLVEIIKLAPVELAALLKVLEDKK